MHATMSLPSAVCILVPHRTSDDRCVAALVPIILACLSVASKRILAMPTGRELVGRDVMEVDGAEAICTANRGRPDDAYHPGAGDRI